MAKYDNDEGLMASVDPTGTGKLRAALRAEINRHVATFLTHVRQAIVKQDLLGVGGLLIPHPAFYAVRDPGGISTKLQVFTNYINQLGYMVLVRQGEWLRPHIDRAFLSGLRAGERWTKTILEEPAAEIDFVNARNELEGIVDAITQQTSRVVSAGLRRGDSANVIYRGCLEVVRKIQRLRLNLLAHEVVVHSHVLGRIYQFREAGYKKVGVIPEARRPTHDHAVFDVQAEIQTAGDDKVCAICQELAENGPYDLDEAEEMIPAHGRLSLCTYPIRRRPRIFS